MFGLHLSGDLALRLSVEGTPYHAIEVPADTTLKQRVYVTAPPSSLQAASSESAIRLWVEDMANGERAYKNSVFNGNGTGAGS